MNDRECTVFFFFNLPLVSSATLWKCDIKSLGWLFKGPYSLICKCISESAVYSHLYSEWEYWAEEGRYKEATCMKSDLDMNSLTWAAVRRWSCWSLTAISPRSLL